MCTNFIKNKKEHRDAMLYGCFSIIRLKLTPPKKSLNKGRNQRGHEGEKCARTMTHANLSIEQKSYLLVNLVFYLAVRCVWTILPSICLPKEV